MASFLLAIRVTFASAGGGGGARRGGCPVRRWGAAWLALAAVAGATAAEVPERWRQLASSVQPFPTVVAFAASRGIPLDGIELAPEAGAPAPGDSVVMLVTLRESNRRTQWLALVQTAALTPEERKLPPLPEETIHTSTGRVLRFKSSRAALNVSYVGPFTASAPPPADPAAQSLASPHRALVSADHLSVGLDRYAGTALRVSERARLAHATNADYFYVGSSSPLSPELLEKGRRYQALAQPTEEEERIIFSVSFALNEFLRAALEVPAFRGTVEKVMLKPSVWSILAAFGAAQFLEYDARSVEQLASADYPFPLPTYQLPVKLSYNGKLALRAALVMTAARPPLEACGGLAVVYAEHPLNPEKQLLIQVVASRRGERPTP